MGAKSPKSTKKQATQKQVKTDVTGQKKKADDAAKQVVKAKK